MAATRGTRNKKIEAVEAQGILDAVRNLDTNTVVSAVNGLQVTLQETLANISASITNKLQQIDTIDKAIQLKEQRLKELYGIEADAVKWDDIQAQHELERVNWEKECNELDEERQQHLEEEARKRTHREDEWNYSFEQKKKRAEDDFGALQAQKLRDEAIRQQNLSANWEARERELKAKEVEFQACKEQVAGIEAKVKSEVAKAEAILKASIERQYKHEAALAQKDAENKVSLSAAAAQAAESRVSSLEEQIEDLKTQLAAARQDAKDVANQALLASSDRRVAEALRQVVDTRDQQPGKGK